MDDFFKNIRDFNYQQAHLDSLVEDEKQRNRERERLNREREEKERIRRLPDCPYCGNKLPKTNVDVCGQCHRDLAWVRNTPCKNDAQSVKELTQQFLEEDLERKRREAIEREAAARRAKKAAEEAKKAAEEEREWKAVAKKNWALEKKVIEKVNQREHFLFKQLTIPAILMIFLGTPLVCFIGVLAGALPEKWQFIQVPLIFLGTPMSVFVPGVFLIARWLYRDNLAKSFRAEQTPDEVEVVGTEPPPDEVEVVGTEPPPYEAEVVGTNRELNDDSGVEGTPAAPSPAYWIRRDNEVHGPFNAPDLLEAGKSRKLKSSDFIGDSEDGPWQQLTREILKSITEGRDV